MFSLIRYFAFRKIPLVIILLAVLMGCGNSINAINPKISEEIKSTVADKAKNIVSQNQDTKGTGSFKLHFIDVGQADCILIQTPDKKNMLIDAGNNEDSTKILGYLKKQNVKRLDVIIATHPHEDHIGSMDSVIKNTEVGSFYMPKVTTNTKTFSYMIAAIKAKGLKINTAAAGVNIDIGPSVKCSLVAPNGSKYDDLNNYSAVTLLTYKNNRFLLTGDAEAISEKEILKAGYDIKADLLKFGHHASSSSSTAEFLKAVSPKYGIIMVGQGNDYGHPHKETLKKIEKAKIKTYRTDLNGTIVAESDGTNIKFTTEK